jgi:glutaredoxin
VARPRITMYSRRRCGLCDEARTVILEQRARRQFDFEEVFIDGDDDLERDYGLRVPVVLVNGTEEFEAQVEPDLLARVLARTGPGGD